MPFFVVLILVISGVIAVDLTSKLLVYNLMAEGDSIRILGNFFKITFLKNKGMAFGLLGNHRFIFISISAVVIVLLLIYLFRFSKDTKFVKIGLALIIGGGIGNMVDRIGLGYVVDMLDFSSFFPYIFNVSDSCVCVGVAIVAIGLIVKEVKESKQKKAAKNAAEETSKGTEKDDSKRE